MKLQTKDNTVLRMHVGFPTLGYCRNIVSLLDTGKIRYLHISAYGMQTLLSFGSGTFLVWAGSGDQSQVVFGSL